MIGLVLPEIPAVFFVIIHNRFAEKWQSAGLGADTEG